MAIQDEPGERLLADMDPERRLASWHLILPDGRRFSAGRALTEVTALLPGGRPVNKLLRGLGPLTNRGYDVVASRRAVPGRMLSRASVRRATERIRARSAAESRIQDDQAASCSTRTPQSCAPAR